MSFNFLILSVFLPEQVGIVKEEKTFSLLIQQPPFFSNPIIFTTHSTFLSPESRTGRARREESPEFEQLQAQIDALRSEIDLNKEEILNLKFPGQTSSV